ncbi:MAG TPA: portal protein, partial [Methanosarcina sp.]|nr:portal protein [Methanosarcina sp.]
MANPRILTFSEVQALRQYMNNNRAPQIPYWKSQAQFIAPERFVEMLPGKRNTGHKSTRNILRNTAGRALRTFVSGMMNGATSRARPWFDIVLVDQAKESTESGRYFAQVVKILNQHLQVSNFYRILPMSYKDIGIFSNSAFAMLPHPKYGFYFMPFAVGSYAIGTDSEGMVNQFSRDFTMTVRQVVEQYGKLKPTGHIDWSNFDPYVQTAWERSNYQLELTLNNFIIPNPDPNPDSLMPAMSMKYQSY